MGAVNVQRCVRCEARNQACHKQKGKARTCSECAILKTGCTWPEPDGSSVSPQDRLVEASEERNTLLRDLVKINRGVVAAMVGIQEGIEEQNALQVDALRETREYRENQRVRGLALKRAVDGVRDELRNYLREQGWSTVSGVSEKSVVSEVVTEKVNDLCDDQRKNAVKGHKEVVPEAVVENEGVLGNLGEVRVEIRDAEEKDLEEL